MDFDFQNVTSEMLYFNFTISAGSTRSFLMTIIDDSVAERYYEYLNYKIGIYDSDRKLQCDFGHLTIEDNDGRHNCGINSMQWREGERGRGRGRESLSEWEQLHVDINIAIIRVTF